MSSPCSFFSLVPCCCDFWYVGCRIFTGGVQLHVYTAVVFSSFLLFYLFCSLIFSCSFTYPSSLLSTLFVSFFPARVGAEKNIACATAGVHTHEPHATGAALCTFGSGCKEVGERKKEKKTHGGSSASSLKDWVDCCVVPKCVSGQRAGVGIPLGGGLRRRLVGGGPLACSRTLRIIVRVGVQTFASVLFCFSWEKEADAK